MLRDLWGVIQPLFWTSLFILSIIALFQLKTNKKHYCTITEKTYRNGKNMGWHTYDDVIKLNDKTYTYKINYAKIDSTVAGYMFLTMVTDSIVVTIDKY